MEVSVAIAVLADPTRRAIFERLASSPCSVTRLREALPVTLSAVSQHLKMLREAGLVTVSSRGRQRIYSVGPEQIDGLLGYLGELRQRQAPLPSAGREDDLESLARKRAAESPQMDADNLLISFRIEHIFRAMEQGMRRVATEVGLTIGESLLLGALGALGPPYESTPTRLKDMLWVTLPGVAKRVDRLVGGGYVELFPHPEDRRGRVVRLSAKGLEVLTAIRRAGSQAPAYVALSGMSRAARLELARLLKEWQRGIDRS